MKSKNMRVAIYTRVSTATQVKENLSLEDQSKSLFKWAEENEHEVIKVYEDAGSSAFKGTRRGFENMLNDIKSGYVKIDCVAVYDTSRFSRNEYDRLRAENILEKYGISLFSFLDRLPEDPDTARLVKGISGMFNEDFSRRNSKRSAVKINATAREGYFTGGIPPYGYKSIPVPNDKGGKERKVLDIDPEKAETVKLIFSLAKSGVSGMPYGVKRIATYLNDKGILKNNKKWDTGSISRILCDPVYYGKREIGHTRIRTDLNDEIIIVDNPAIVPKKDFDLIRKIMKSRAPNKKNLEDKGRQSKTLLTGIVKCGYCGCNLVINTGKSGQYDYYKCRDKIKCSVKVCNCPTFPKKKLESAVISSLIGKVFIPPYICDIDTKLKERLKEQKTAQSLKKANLQKQWNAADNKIANILDEIANKNLSMSKIILRHLKVYEDKLAAIEQEINDLDKATRVPVMSFGKHHVEEFCLACEKVLLGGNNEATKALLLAFVKEVRVYADKIDFEGSKLQLISNVANNKAGYPEGVPSLISIWR